jgi:hypothetical protein
MRPCVTRISEVDPRRRRIHVAGEVHPGELAERGYQRLGGEWVLDLRRPDDDARAADALVREFEALRALGYAFAEGDEWSPAEIGRRYLNPGSLGRNR